MYKVHSKEVNLLELVCDKLSSSSSSCSHPSVFFEGNIKFKAFRHNCLAHLNSFKDFSLFPSYGIKNVNSSKTEMSERALRRSKHNNCGGNGINIYLHD